MQKRSITEGRKFSLKQALREPLLQGEAVSAYRLFFEGGQAFNPEPGEASYQVLEGDALFMDHNGPARARKGEVIVGRPHEIENAGGGLLVILETRSA